MSASQNERADLGVWLIIAAIFGVDGIGAQRHQPVEVNGKLDHHPASFIPAHEIAGFKDRLEESICQIHRPHCWLPASRRNLWAGMVNQA